MYGLINEEPEMKLSPSWYNDNVCHACIYVYHNTTDLESGAYGVQEFLIDCGHKIPKDGNFGDKTATALGTWVYGASAGVNTVVKLAERMKKDGWDIGTITSTPYGPRMASQVAKLIRQMCDKVNQICTKQYDNQSKLDSGSRGDWKKEKELFNPKTNGEFNRRKSSCEAFLNKNVPVVKQKFIKWINSKKTQERLNSQLHFVFGINEIKNVINRINRNIYFCKGPYEDEIFFKRKASGYYNPNTKTISINYDSPFTNDDNPTEVFTTLIHETTHWIEGQLKGEENTINDPQSVQKVYPKSVKDAWEKNWLDLFSFSKVSINDVSQESINQFAQIGVTKSKIQSWLNDWNADLDKSIAKNNDLYDVKYKCSRQEKEANLKSIRFLYTGSLDGSLTKMNLRDIMYSSKNDGNEYYFVICWVGNAFNPPPFEFLSLSNQLAANEKPKENNISNNIDFSDIDTDPQT